MGGYKFSIASNLGEALSALARLGPDVCVVAGGTDVTRRIRNGQESPALLLDISRIGKLRGIREKNGQIIIGALTTIAQIASSELLMSKAPALYEASCRFADPNTRNRATLGGNIVNASPGADTLPPLFALDAQVLITGEKGDRRMPVCEFITGSYKTALKPSELVAGVSFAPCPNSAFTKIGLRKAMAVSVATAAVALIKDDEGVVSVCRVAFGALGPTPVRGFYSEKALSGKKPTSEVLASAMAEAEKDISPRDGLRGTKEYRNSTVGVILKRTFQAAYQKGG